jgi:protein ImuA
LRRLHLAAQEGGCPLFALRPASVRGQSSPAPLRLVLEPAAQGQLAVTVFKRRGPAMVQPLLLTLPVAGLPAGRALRRTPVLPVLPARVLLSEPGDAVVRATPERIAA